jgi:hypothetical protein
MAGVKALRRIQFGKESVAGTAVAATVMYRASGATIQDNREVVFVEEDVGVLTGMDRTYISRYGAEIAFDPSPATFEQFPYWLQASIKDVTPTTDTGSGYIYTYDINESSTTDTLATYTIETGDDQEAEEMEYSYVRSFELSGVAREAWNVSGTWGGRQCSTSTFTSLSLNTVEEMLFSKTKLYIDGAASTDTVGTTLKSNTLLEATLTYNSGLMEVDAADGVLYFSFVKRTQPECLLSLTFEHDGSSTAEKDAWRAQTARQIQLLIQGSNLTTGGAYTVKTCKINLVGKWESFTKLEERNGNDIVTGVFRMRYNLTKDMSGQFIVVNELSALA